MSDKEQEINHAYLVHGIDLKICLVLKALELLLTILVVLKIKHYKKRAEYRTGKP